MHWWLCLYAQSHSVTALHNSSTQGQFTLVCTENDVNPILPTSIRWPLPALHYMQHRQPSAPGTWHSPTGPVSMSLIVSV